MDGCKKFLKSNHFIFEKKSLLYFSSLPVVVQPPLKPNFYYKYVTNCLFFQPIKSHNFFENMTNEITLASRMSTSKFSSDHETFVQIFQLSCNPENKIYMRVCRKNIRVQCDIIFYHVLFTCAKYFAFCRSRIFVS